MPYGVLVCSFSAPARRKDDEDVAFGQIELGVVAVAEPLGRVNNLVEHQLQPFSASNCPVHAAQRTLPGPHVLQLACENSSVVGCRLHRQIILTLELRQVIAAEQLEAGGLVADAYAALAAARQISQSTAPGRATR